MGASFGSGFVYSFVSGAPNPLQAALTTGIAFALFNGLFYQVGDAAHAATAHMHCMHAHVLPRHQ
jgi:hypothetical protein